MKIEISIYINLIFSSSRVTYGFFLKNSGNALHPSPVNEFVALLTLPDFVFIWL